MNKQNNQDDQVNTQNFMDPIYKKVAKLKQNLNKYEKNRQSVLNNRGQTENIELRSNSLKFINYMGKVHCTKLNQQLKIQRNQQILKKRLQFQLNIQDNKNKQKFIKTARISGGNHNLWQNKFNGYHSLSNNNPSRQNLIKLKTQNMLSFSLTKKSLIKKSYTTAQFNNPIDLINKPEKLNKLNDKNLSQDLNNKFQRYQRQNTHQKTIVKNDQKNKIKTHKSQSLQEKQKHQFKISSSLKKIKKITNFLTKNQDDKILKNKVNKKQQKKQKQNNMNKPKDMAYNKKYSQNIQSMKQENILFLKQEESQFANQIDFDILKFQKSRFQQSKSFKPIGSAKIIKKHEIDDKNQVQCQEQSISHLNNVKKQQLVNEKMTKQSTVIARESKSSNYSGQQNKKVTYLQKGDRMRQLLYKKLLKNSSSEHQQMIYVRQYDQWVPASLVQNNRKQLQTYMQLLLGDQKNNKSKKFTLTDIDIVYL